MSRRSCRSASNGMQKPTSYYNQSDFPTVHPGRIRIKGSDIQMLRVPALSKIRHCGRKRLTKQLLKMARMFESLHSNGATVSLAQFS